MKIELESAGDLGPISAITTAAFRDVEHSSQTEAAIVEALREAGALSLSLVARDGSEVVGHVGFSPVLIDDAEDGWFGLGPVSVRPDRQRSGIGAALIRDGLDRLKGMGARGCVVLGDPDFYRRFGFETDAALRFEGAPPEYFMRLVFSGSSPAGRVAYHQGFDAH